MGGEPKIDEMLPPEPTKPSDSECCGSGCTPCVFEIYEKQLSKWKIECDKIKKSGYSELNHSTLEIENFISQEKYIELEILEIFQESKSMKIFRFQWNKANGTFPVELGQHVLIREQNISRQYTILRVDDENCIFEILIKIYPQRPTQNITQTQITSALDKKKSGDKLHIRGPFGTTFDYKPNVFSHLFLISCGTGLAPMYRIIQTCLENEKDETRIRVLFSSRLDDIPLISSFKRWSAFWNFQAVHFISKSENICDNNKMQLPYYGMQIIQHRINIEELKEQIGISKCNLNTTLFCICGTKSFEKDIVNYLSKIGISENRIKLF